MSKKELEPDLKNLGKTFDFFKEILDRMKNEFKNDIESCYIVNYDISKHPPETRFDVPIYNKNTAIKKWVVGFWFIKINNLQNISFVDTAFQKAKKLTTIRFFPGEKFEIKKNDGITIYYPKDKYHTLNKSRGKFLKELESKERFDEFRSSIIFPKNLNGNTFKIGEINCQCINNYYEKADFNNLITIALGFLGKYKYGESEIDLFKSLSFIIKPTYKIGKKEVTSGGLVVFWKELCLKQIIEKEEEIWKMVSPYIYTKTIDDLRKLSLSYALRSAVAAIMARNMSHNIGSHVLNYLSNPEELDKLWVI